MYMRTRRIKNKNNINTRKNRRRKRHKSHKYYKYQHIIETKQTNKTKDVSIKPFVKLNCSPKGKNEVKEYTCYTDNDLHKLRDMWNARHSDKPITTNDSKEIWNMLKNYYANICNKESCWVRQMTKGTKMEKELLDSFSPATPEKWKKNPIKYLTIKKIIRKIVMMTVI